VLDTREGQAANASIVPIVSILSLTTTPLIVVSSSTLPYLPSCPWVPSLLTATHRKSSTNYVLPSRADSRMMGP